MSQINFSKFINMCRNERTAKKHFWGQSKLCTRPALADLLYFRKSIVKNHLNFYSLNFIKTSPYLQFCFSRGMYKLYYFFNKKNIV